MNFHCGIKELVWLYRHFPFVDLLMLNSWLPRYGGGDDERATKETKSLDELKYEMMRKGFK